MMLAFLKLSAEGLINTELLRLSYPRLICSISLERELENLLFKKITMVLLNFIFIYIFLWIDYM